MNLEEQNQNNEKKTTAMSKEEKIRRTKEGRARWMNWRENEEEKGEDAEEETEKLRFTGRRGRREIEEKLR